MNTLPEWATCSEWNDGDFPQIPYNPEYPWITVYGAKNGERMAFSYRTYEESKSSLDEFIKLNQHNPNFLCALMAHRSMFKNDKSTLHNRHYS